LEGRRARRDDPEASRTIRIGYDRLASLVRLSWVTVKANLRSLEKKLAIQVLAAEDSANRKGSNTACIQMPRFGQDVNRPGCVVRRTRGWNC